MSVYHVSHAQLDIQAVSSFRDCVQLDPSLNGTSAEIGASLNCSVFNGKIPPVTTMDLILTPGLSTGSSFDILLTTVLDNQAGRNTTSGSSTTCDSDTPNTQLCVATRTATMSIDSSRPVFTYNLRRETNFQIPYCYASAVQFEEKWSGEGNFGSRPCHASRASASCSSTIPNNLAPTDSALMCVLNSKHVTSVTNANRYQQLFPITGTAPSGNEYLRGYFENIDGGDDDLGAYAFLLQGKGIYNFHQDSGKINEAFLTEYVCDANRCQGNFYNPQSTTDSKIPKCCSSDTCDSRNLDIRIPCYKPWPSAFGRAAENLWDTQNEIESTYTRDPQTPGQTVWKSESQLYDTVQCASPRCTANQDERRRLIRFDKAADNTGTRYVNTRHAILAIPPTCTAYRVDPDPQVEIQINITVTTTSATGVNATEKVRLNNFRPGEVSSSRRKLVRGTIRNVQSVDAALGPSIDGYIVVCGREGASVVPDMIDMRALIPRAEGVKFEDLPVTENPWPYLIEQFTNTAKLGDNKARKYFFPHPFDYVKPGHRGKSPDGLGLDDDFGQTFWYFVPQDIALREFGSGCNQVGMRGSWTKSAANQATLCRLPAHACTPGVGDFVNGGRKTSTPCTVSGLFNLVSGTLKDSARNNLMDNSIFDKSLSDAQRFMPGDTFAERSGVNAKSSQLYNPEQPNAWLANDKLVFEQSGKASFSDAISVELSVDFLGSFVTYENRVSKGEIELTQNSLDCKMEQGDSTTVSARVKNLADIGVGVATTYRLVLTCNETQSGLDVLTPAQLVGPIQPGLTSDNIVFDVNQDGKATQRALCVFQLSSATDVIIDPIMDRKSVTCNVRGLGPSPVFIPPNSTDPPVVRKKCEGACAKCHWLNGTVYKDWCSTLIVIGVALLLLIIVAAFASAIGIAIKIKTQGQQDSRDANRTLDQYFEDIGNTDNS